MLKHILMYWFENRLSLADGSVLTLIAILGCNKKYKSAIGVFILGPIVIAVIEALIEM